MQTSNPTVPTPPSVSALLDEIQAQADAASPGPWTHEPYGDQNQNSDYTGGNVFDAAGDYLVSEVSDADGAFIAASRTRTPTLASALQAVYRLHSPVATYRDADECDHDEPDATDSPEWEAWRERHPDSVTGDPICLDSPTDEPYCSECYDEDNGHEFGSQASWPCTTLRLIAHTLGAQTPTFAPVPAPRQNRPVQTEQLDFGTTHLSAVTR